MEIEAGAGGDVKKGGGDGSGILLMNEEHHEMMGGAYSLVWEDLTVVLPNSGISRRSLVSPKRLLRGLNGYAEPGRIMAIMGPSGSGKSTLLDSLAGRLSMNTIMTGDILLNGKKMRLDYGIVAYVTQEDVLLGTLTVRETMVYSANLRLPTSLKKEEVIEIVEGTLMEMGLQECADGRIGNWHCRGISGGEKKRLSIALEILTRPRILFLDEPTSGLDSASAFFVIQSLRNVARDGRTVISSVHQPSGEVFSLFDDLCLLSGGETVYMGEAKMAIKFFAESGFPCPSRRNPSDHFLRCINSDFDEVATTLKGSQKQREALDPLMDIATTEIKTTLIHKYKCSEYASKARARIKQLTSNRGVEVEVKRGSQAGWLKQLSTLTRRSSINMSRDFGYYWLRLVIYIIVSVCVGTIYYDIGTGYNSILARGACGGFISGFMTFMSIGGFPNFIEEMKVFYKERRNGYYGVTVFIMSNFISSFPFLFMIAISAGTITYHLAKFRPGFSYYLFFCLNLLCNISAIESCMMVVASIVPNFLMGLVTGAGLIGIMMMTSGFFRLLDDLPKVFWRYPISYISFQSWALQGAYKNDLLGLEFDNLFPGMPKLKGSYVITKMYKIPIEHSKWWDLFAVLMILISYRIIFFLILKLKEHATPFFRSLYTKRAVRVLKKRPSFRKIPSFGSKRYIPRHSLSSQEGLTSPIS